MINFSSILILNLLIVIKYYEKIIKLLLQKKEIDINEVDDKNKKAFDYAKMMKSKNYFNDSNKKA